jgi:hypothetical protein
MYDAAALVAALAAILGASLWLTLLTYQAGKMPKSNASAFDPVSPSRLGGSLLERDLYTYLSRVGGASLQTLLGAFADCREADVVNTVWVSSRVTIDWDTGGESVWLVPSEPAPTGQMPIR